MVENLTIETNLKKMRMNNENLAQEMFFSILGKFAVARLPTDPGNKEVSSNTVPYNNINH